MSFASKKTPCISLTCKLVVLIQYQEYEYDLFQSVHDWQTGF